MFGNLGAFVNGNMFMGLFGADIGVKIDPDRPTLGLSIADQQLIEIAKAISLDAKVLVMDEPTAALSGVEVERLFAVARSLRDEGRALLFISHRFDEVFALCDTVTVKTALCGYISTTSALPTMSRNNRDTVVGDGLVLAEDRRRHRRRSARGRLPVDQQLHDLDLVPDIEVGGRFVEDQDRGRLGERDRHEHELALAHREPPGVAFREVQDADAREGRLHGFVVDRPRPAQRRIVRQPPQPDDFADAHRERHLDKLGDDRDLARDCLAVARPDRLAPQHDGAGTRFEDAGQDPQQRRLAGPVRPDQGDPFAGAQRQVTSARIVRSPYATVTFVGAEDRGSQLVARARLVEKHRKNGAPRMAITTPTGRSPSNRATRSARTSRIAPKMRRERHHPPRGRAHEQPDDVRHDEADEPDQPGDRDRRGRRHRRQDQQDAALPPDVDAEVARRRVTEQQAVERARARARSTRHAAEDDRRRRSSRRSHEAAARPPSRNEKIARRFVAGDVHRHRQQRGEDRPDRIAGQQQPGHPARSAGATEPEDEQGRARGRRRTPRR